MKLQTWLKGGQGYSKTKGDLITHGESSFKPIPNLGNFQIQKNVVIKMWDDQDLAELALANEDRKNLRK